jgi:magnesium-transporting ATPase (P-type)
VAVCGREGFHAARAADYALASFAGLRRLLFIHGRYAFNRNAFISQYYFYKSFFFCCIQLLFAMASQYSGASWFDSLALTMYSMVYTSVPIMAYVLHKDVREETVLQLPALYNTHLSDFTLGSVGGWLLLAVAQSLCLAYMSFLQAFWSEDHIHFRLVERDTALARDRQCMYALMALHCPLGS